jgi:hypothetical protein
LLTRGLATGGLRRLAVLWRKVKRVEHQPARSQSEITTIATMRECKKIWRLPFWRFAWYEPLLMVLMDDLMVLLGVAVVGR